MYEYMCVCVNRMYEYMHAYLTATGKPQGSRQYPGYSFTGAVS